MKRLCLKQSASSRAVGNYKLMSLSPLPSKKRGKRIFKFQWNPELQKLIYLNHNYLQHNEHAAPKCPSPLPLPTVTLRMWPLPKAATSTCPKEMVNWTHQLKWYKSRQKIEVF